MMAYSDASVTFIPIWQRDGTIRGYTAIDTADATWVMQWRWHDSHGYAARGVKVNSQRRTIYLHRELLGLPRTKSGIETDHRNLDRRDNRRANLRAVTKQLNLQNLRARIGGPSAYRGVSWNQTIQRWCAAARHGNRRHYLGPYATEWDAARAAAQYRATHMPGTIEDPALLAGPPPVRVPQNPARGERQHWARYTESQVREWRARFAIGDVTIAQLARGAGIAHATLSHILHRRTWQHVDGEEV